MADERPHNDLINEVYAANRLMMRIQMSGTATVAAYATAVRVQRELLNLSLLLLEVRDVKKT